MNLRRLKPLLLSSLLLTLLLPAQADTVFNYDGFYARMKKSEQAKYSDITLAFLLQQAGSTARCQIKSAEMTTDISSEPLTLAANGELLLPYSELLNNRKALIHLTQSPEAVACDLNFRLRSRMPLSVTLELAMLQKTHQQFQGLLQDLAGMGKYFLPEMTGVTVLFKEEALAIEGPPALLSRVQCAASQCHIDLTGLEQGAAGALTFSKMPEYLVPWLQR